jgi:hypothetical protein
MQRCGTRTAISETLLIALDDCLDAMLSTAPGTAGGERAHHEHGQELAALLAVAGELVRSRESINERLAWKRQACAPGRLPSQ